MRPASISGGQQTMFFKEPLLHFLLLGVLIFVVYDFASTDAPAEDEIVVSRAQQQRLVDAFSVTWKRPPTQQELQGIVDDWIREEVAYREAVAMGLDTDDTIIRRRLRQKLEVLADDIVSIVEPTTEELERFLAAHPADYAEEPTYSLRQVSFSVDARGNAAKQDAEQALLLLRTGGQLTNPASVGDPIPLPHRLVGKRESEIAAQFGRDFLAGLKAIEPDGWRGPITSGYGLHLVTIDKYVPSRPPALDEVEREVRRDWHHSQRNQAIDGLYERLVAKYRITVEEPADQQPPGS